MRHVSFPSIEQFRNAVTEVTLLSSYIGDAEDGTLLYDESLPKPTLIFQGTVKLHGTNAGVSYSPVDGLWYQSRESLITPTQDNAGFARWAEANRGAFEKLFSELRQQNGLVGDREIDADSILTIFGEWAGQGIQLGVGITQLPKAFYVFAANLTQGETEIWLDSSGLRSEEIRIFNVEDYATYQIAIDFNNPQTSQAELADLTAKVEAECPVAKARGASGVGEGIVWVADYAGKRIRFKVKGEKHSVSKGKEVAGVAPEKLASIEEFVAYAVTDNRFQQALTVVFGDPKKADVKRLGEVIHWMNRDVQKEESDTLAASGLTWKDVNGQVAAKTRALFFAAPV